MKIVFMGTPTFSVPILESLINKYEVALVVTQPDSVGKRGKGLIESPVKKCAIAHNIAIFQPERIRKDYDIIKSINPDLIITSAYGQIIPKGILDIPKMGCINVHGSLLPKYRGGAPIQRAIMNGDKEIGITIMYMDEGMDSGDMIKKGSFEISDEDFGTINRKLSYLGRDLLMEVLSDLERGIINRYPQDTTLVTFAKIIKNEDRIIDLNNKAIDIHNKVRALSPEPTAYINILGDEIKVFKTHVVKCDEKLEVGTILKVFKNGLVLKCLEDAISLDVIQYPGKNPMNIKDFMNGKGRKYLENSKL